MHTNAITLAPINLAQSIFSDIVSLARLPFIVFKAKLSQNIFTVHVRNRRMECELFTGIPFNSSIGLEFSENADRNGDQKIYCGSTISAYHEQQIIHLAILLPLAWQSTCR